jgi:hypothetical protein
MLRRMENPLTARANDEQALEEALKDLNAYPIPTELQYLYGWFCDLSAQRGSNGYGPNPLNSSVIRDWAAMSGHNINPWEFETIRAMDRKWLKVYSDLNAPEPTDTKAKSKTINAQQ